jgi:predicted metal-dependent peptidase
MPILYDRVIYAGSSDKEMVNSFEASGMDYDKKCKVVHNLRARVICYDESLKGLLTFVEHVVVKEGHPMFNSVAYTNGDKMFFADKFFSQDIPVQCAIILHEMFHIVFRHVSRGRKRIPSLWNIACDAILNQSIGFKDNQSIEAGQHIYFNREHVVNLDSLYEEFNIPSHEHRHFSQWTSESLYEFLIKKLKEDLEKEVKKQEEEKNKECDSDENNEPTAGDGSEGNQECDSDEETDKKGKPNKKGKKGTSGNEPSDKSGNSSQSGTGGNQQKQYSDSELGRLEKEVDDLMDRLAKKHKMFSGNDLKDDEDKSSNDGVNDAINDAIWTQRYNRAKAQSNTSKNSILGRVNPDVYKPQIPWYKELRKYLVKRCMPLTEASWQRASRRLPSLHKAGSRTYLPGIQNMKGLDKMMVIIDTSGSCFNEEELTMFCTEIQDIQETTGVELALIFADTEIRSEQIVKADGTKLLDKIKKGWVKPEGGGGTDMVTAFVEGKKKYRPLLSVIASDGYTPFPTRAQVKGSDLLWVINTDVEVPKEAGRALYIHPKEN